MAVELEEMIMAEIGLGSNYRWFNGSGSCGYIRRNAVDELPKVAKKHGLTIAPSWLNHCREADEVDQVDGEQYSLTNTWIACSYAIQDAIYRKEGGEQAGFSPDVHQWQFWSDKERNKWNQRNLHNFDETNIFERIKIGKLPFNLE